MVINGLQEIFEISSSANATLPPFKENDWKIQYSDDFNTHYNEIKLPLPFASSEVFQSKVCDWRRLTEKSKECKAVYELTLDVTGSNFTFRPGDTIGIIAQNNDAEVEAIISHLNIQSEADIPYNLFTDDVKKSKIPPHIPTKSSLRHVLRHCIDLRGVIKKLFLLALSRHTKEENERKILEFLSSKEGSVAYKSHVLEKNITVLDIFHICKSCKPPVQLLLANLPRLLPRPYSIANSGLKDHDKIKICFSVINIGNRKGLVTGWLEEILNKEFSIENRINNLNILNDHRTIIEVPIYLRKNISSFSMPSVLEKPLILIGPGTGIAPFMGFLEEIHYRKSNGENISGEVWLFFGCRNPKLDFIYRKELLRFEEDGVLSKFVTAFSRSDNNGIKYVQNALMQNGKEVVRLVENGASIYVCGDLKKMAINVKECFKRCLIEYGNRSAEEADKYLSDMEEDKRYLIDIWN